LRLKLRKEPLSLDSKLTKIAQHKAENMAKYDYVGHWTPDGKDIGDIADDLQIRIV
jgi:uncharacterized protein YkwD